MDPEVEARIQTLEAAMLAQEHRFTKAVINFIRHKNNSATRAAAIEGLVSSFFVRGVSTVVLSGGVLAAVAGGLLAWQANTLTAAQNERMDVQTIIMEAQRRSQAFQTELGQILDAIASEQREHAHAPQQATHSSRAEDGQAGTLTVAESRPQDVPALQPSRALLARLAALSQALRPFPILHVEAPEAVSEDGGILLRLARGFHRRTQPYPRLDGALGSPERAQLLLALIAVGVDLDAVNRAGVTFERADFSNRHLRNINFGPADLRGARFSCTVFVGVDLTRAQLVGADFERATFMPERLDMQTGDISDKNLMLFGSLFEIRYVSADLSGLNLLPYMNSFLSANLPRFVLPESQMPEIAYEVTPLADALRNLQLEKKEIPEEANNWYISRTRETIIVPFSLGNPTPLFSLAALSVPAPSPNCR